MVNERSRHIIQIRQDIKGNTSPEQSSVNRIGFTLRCNNTSTGKSKDVILGVLDSDILFGGGGGEQNINFSTILYIRMILSEVDSEL